MEKVKGQQPSCQFIVQQERQINVRVVDLWLWERRWRSPGTLALHSGTLRLVGLDWGPKVKGSGYFIFESGTSKLIY